MFSKLHERLGTAGLVVAVIALIAALTGTAFAAAGLNGKQKKEVKKIAKQFAGKNGAPGATGPAGPAGAAGKDGSNGTNGTDGTNGKDGTSVTVSPAAPGECPTGGSKFTAGATTGKACNGKDGDTGFTETLPPGKTETGVWGTATVAQRKTSYDVSFSIPLAEAPEAIVVTPTEMDNGTGATNGCPWDGVGIPTADPGKFCVYEAINEATANLAALQILHPEWEDTGTEFIGFGGPGAGNSGAVIRTICPGNFEAECVGFGAWAVTADEP
jgi:hypothetical protein